MFGYQGMQSGLPAFLVGEFNTFVIFFFAKTTVTFRICPTTNIKSRSYIFGQNLIMSSHLLIQIQLYFDSGLDIVEKYPPPLPTSSPLSFRFFQKIKQTICNNISYLIKLLSLLQFGPLFLKYRRFLCTKPQMNMFFNSETEY